MIATPIKTPIIKPHTGKTLEHILDECILSMPEGSVLAITSKIVSLLEGSVVAASDIDRETLIVRESEQYLPASFSNYGYHFTIKDNSFVAMAGIDESNSDGYYVLWPKDSVATANKVRAYLQKRFGVEKVGVIIVDSTSAPMRLGTVGMFIGYSGFKALLDYTGSPDLFGRKFVYSRLSIAGGLASSAVLCMGEANEQMPLCLFEDIPNIEFVDADSDEQELACMRIALEDDLYAPFLTQAPWKKQNDV